ncbi:GntR family transcriptional regulator [Gryllotalpicola ginsengisoli]|uniref:GntR family transcriptional regulator n=1 Tax=Gryllotalpicola ginsengisoli TaxID=444608 RepID=UPI0003B3F34E|nr:GntR family transcriptional regulator [Gryllotalpicola ginsengisoli]
MANPPTAAHTAGGAITKPSSLRAQVQRAISASIVSGEIPPGAVISVPTLAAQFQVSATPVREAILDLEKRGFVVALRNKGFRVTDVDEDALRQIVEVRRLLEPEAMYRLAPDFGKRDAKQARRLADRIVRGARDEDLNAYLAADHEFHLTLLAMLGNPLLVELVSDLRERTRLVGLRTLLHTEELNISAEEHHRILDLLEAHDADGVRTLMERHIGHVVGWWSGQREDS